MIGKQTTAKAKKHSFTLFEILLVMALIALALGSVGFYFPKALREEAFEKGVSQVISKIYLAQEVMLDYQLDLSLFLTEKEDGKGIVVKIEPNQETSQKLTRLLNRHCEIKGIEEMAMDGIRTKSIELKFEGKTGAISKGTLQLFSQSRSCALCLNGHPGKIKKGFYEEKTTKADYPEEILSSL